MQKGRKAMQGVSFCRADTGFDCLHPDCVCVIKIKAAPRYQFQRFAPSCTGLPRRAALSQPALYCQGSPAAHRRLSRRRASTLPCAALPGYGKPGAWGRPRGAARQQWHESADYQPADERHRGGSGRDAMANALSRTIR